MQSAQSLTQLALVDSQSTGLMEVLHYKFAPLSAQVVIVVNGAFEHFGVETTSTSTTKAPSHGDDDDDDEGDQQR